MPDSSQAAEKAHLLRRRAWALVAAYLEYALTHLRWVPRPGYPSEGWVTPPCIWTFLSSLGKTVPFRIPLSDHFALHGLTPVLRRVAIG